MIISVIYISRYYGIVVVPDPDFDFGMGDFTSTYPNVQQYDNQLRKQTILHNVCLA